MWDTNPKVNRLSGRARQSTVFPAFFSAEKISFCIFTDEIYSSYVIANRIRIVTKKKCFTNKNMTVDERWDSAERFYLSSIIYRGLHTPESTLPHKALNDFVQKPIQARNSSAHQGRKAKPTIIKMSTYEKSCSMQNLSNLASWEQQKLIQITVAVEVSICAHMAWSSKMKMYLFSRARNVLNRLKDMSCNL